MDSFQQQNQNAANPAGQQGPQQDANAKRDDLRGMSYAQGQQALSPEVAAGGGKVERLEAADSRLGTTKQPVQVSAPKGKGDEGKAVKMKVDAKDPEQPGQVNHLWFNWKQTSGPAWLSTRGMYTAEPEFTAPYVKGDQVVAGEVTVTKRGYLNVQGLSTTQRFEVLVRDTGDEAPQPKEAKRQADPRQQPVPGTLPTAALLLPWLRMMQMYQRPPAQPQPPQVKAPGETKVTPGDRASLRASVNDPDGRPDGLRTVWTQDGGPPLAEVKGQSSPELSFKAPNVSKQQTIVGRVTAVDKQGLKGEDKFRVVVAPRIAVNEKGRVWGDPHFEGGDGGKFDVMGKDGGVYQVLSDAGVQVNAKFKKWNGTKITVVDNCGTVITFKDASGQTKRSELYFESGIAKLDGKAMPRNKSVKLADGGSALFLANGDLIVDTREGYKVTFHSMGAGNRRYVNFDVQTGARGVGDGANPGGLLGQTFDADNAKKNGKRGAGAQGEGAIEGKVTDYELAGGVFGNPKPGKAAPQPMSAAAGRPLQRSTVLVSANPTDMAHEGFIDTGLDVADGDEVFIKASGKAAEAGRKLNRDPDGDPRYRHPRKADFLCGSAPAFALVGRVSGGPSFHVGSNHAAKARGAGRLLLGFNDLKGTFRDNSGEYLADVQVLKGITKEAPKPAPAARQPVQQPRANPAQAAQMARQNMGAMLGMLGALGSAGATNTQQAVPWAPQQQAPTQATAQYANPAASALLMLMAQRMAALARMRPQPVLPRAGIQHPLGQRHHGVVIPRAPWIAPRKVAPRVAIAAEQTLQPGEKGRLQARVTDPDQGRAAPPTVQWRQDSGPSLRNVVGDGSAQIEFSAPDVSKRTTLVGKAIAKDADGLKGEATFRVNVEPRVAANEKGRVAGDPHFYGADGGKYDIMGKPGGVYNILSDAGLRVTSLFKRYHRESVTVMDKIGATVVAPGGKKSEVEFRPNGAFLNGKALAKGKSTPLADGGAALYFGDRLVVDTREGYKLTFYSRRSGSVLYCDLDVESGARGVGSGGDPGGLLGQTFDADNKAKNGRRGANAQGEGAIAGKVTDYELSGGIFGKTKDGKASPLPATDQQRIIRRTVLVKANPGTGKWGFVDSGIAVDKGDTVLVRASGSASEHGSRLRRGPDGDRGYRHSRKSDFMAPDAPAFALVGRVAGEARGHLIGSSHRGKIGKNGKLQLAFNDLAGTFGDNHGEYVADVQVIKEFA